MRVVCVCFVVAAAACFAVGGAFGALEWHEDPGMLGWGKAGHAITAALATNMLSSEAQGAVDSILGPGVTLESIASWADSAKYTSAFAWSKTYHYNNLNSWQCGNMQIPAQCHNSGSPNSCLVGAMTNYTTRLVQPDGPFLSPDNVPVDTNLSAHNIALRFVTHFYGDATQPLHSGFTVDEGGNTIRGKFLGESGSLHYMWDDVIIDNRISTDFGGSQEKYIDYLQSQISGPWAPNATEWASCSHQYGECGLDWSNESAKLACEFAYVDSKGNVIKNDFDLGEDYYHFTLPVVEAQLARGGVRLGAALNKIFASSEYKRSAAKRV